MTRVRLGATRALELLTDAYHVPRLQVSVFDRPRPSVRGRRIPGELHGDYTPPGKIRIWARTAKRAQRVAFLTFLDTLLHEFLHHYDLTYLKLRDTVHSENFYRRLGSLCVLVKRDLSAASVPAAPTPLQSELSFSAIWDALRVAPEADGVPRAIPAGAPIPAQPTTPRRKPRPAPQPVQPLLPF